MKLSLTDKTSNVRFICNLCGIRSADAILCRRNTCPTEILVRADSAHTAALMAMALKEPS